MRARTFRVFEKEILLAQGVEEQWRIDSELSEVHRLLQSIELEMQELDMKHGNLVQEASELRQRQEEAEARRVQAVETWERTNADIKQARQELKDQAAALAQLKNDIKEVNATLEALDEEAAPLREAKAARSKLLAKKGRAELTEFLVAEVNDENDGPWLRERCGELGMMINGTAAELVQRLFARLGEDDLLPVAVDGNKHFQTALDPIEKTARRSKFKRGNMATETSEGEIESDRVTRRLNTELVPRKDNAKADREQAEDDLERLARLLKDSQNGRKVVEARREAADSRMNTLLEAEESLDDKRRRLIGSTGDITPTSHESPETSSGIKDDEAAMFFLVGQSLDFLAQVEGFTLHGNTHPFFVLDALVSC